VDSPDIRLTVIVPVYNCEEFLDKCLESLVTQSLPRIEFLTINDGSTDGSLRLLHRYARYDARFRVLNHANRGVGWTRNRGIASARGEFVSFLDADDYLPHTDTLEALYENAKQHSVEICGGSFSEDHGTWIRTRFLNMYTKYTFDEDGLMDYWAYQFDYGYHRFAYATEFLRKHGLEFPAYRRFQDPPFFVRAMALAGKFYAMARPTYCYRFGHQELTWDHDRVYDLVSGLYDNLELADRLGFEELRRLTWWRLASEYGARIKARIDDDDAEVTDQIKRCVGFAAGPVEQAQAEALLFGSIEDVKSLKTPADAFAPEAATG
jgi:glycosyltransferase involved in cell wall biosynthesis